LIWYQEEVNPKDTPEDSLVELLGVLNPPESDLPLIQILVHISGPNQKQIVLYAHHPSMRHHTEPNPDDVYTRYRHKIIKAKKRLDAAEFTDLFRW
jgi:hypothetical protein